MKFKLNYDKFESQNLKLMLQRKGNFSLQVSLNLLYVLERLRFSIFTECIPTINYPPFLPFKQQENRDLVKCCNEQVV